MRQFHEGIPALVTSLCHVRTHKTGTARSRECPQWSQPLLATDVGLGSCKNVKNQFLFFKSSSLWYFGVATQDCLFSYGNSSVFLNSLETVMPSVSSLCSVWILRTLPKLLVYWEHSVHSCGKGNESSLSILKPLQFSFEDLYQIKTHTQRIDHFCIPMHIIIF